MNIQSMNNNQINPTNDTIIPETPQIKNFNNETNVNEVPVETVTPSNNTENIIEPSMPNLNQPTATLESSFNMNNPNNINLDFNSISTPNNELLTPNNNMESRTPVVDIPLFSEQNINQDMNNTGIQQSVEVPSQPSFATTEPVNKEPEQPIMTETPLFNQELNNPPVGSAPIAENTNLNESFYDIPVNISPVIEDNKEDQVNKVQQLLSSNDIEYKTYSNETGHCIIIEI